MRGQVDEHRRLDGKIDTTARRGADSGCPLRCAQGVLRDTAEGMRHFARIGAIMVSNLFRTAAAELSLAWG
jgi:hypothetical protein